jgi:hypothetical protein
MFEGLGEKRKWESKGTNGVCVASTELSVGVKVNVNTTYYILIEFALCQYMVLVFYYDSLVCCSSVCYYSTNIKALPGFLLCI